MPYVYFVGDHEGGGAQYMHATLDRAHVPAMVKAWHEKYEPKRDFEPVGSSLEKFLTLDDEVLAGKLGGAPLVLGWGGVRLYVVKLEP